MAEEEISRLLPELVQLRQDLHRQPELSGQEEATARLLRAYLQKYMPDKLLSRLGSGTGLAAVFEGTENGPTVLFRADMDALPIPETIEVSYASQQKGVSHKCGHDGHMAMVAGLAPLLYRNPLKKGRVILLMQPAEETGMGAKALLEDPQLKELAPDFIFGLHNLPGFPLGQVVLREGTFCAASKGVRVHLKGRSAHAAEPHKSISPAPALAKLLQQLPSLPQQLPGREMILLSLTHAHLGEATFGVSPGEAVLQFTLRAYLEEDMLLLQEAVEKLVQTCAQEHGLTCTLSYHEEFPATANAPLASQILEKAAKNTGYSIHWKEKPFGWSEDFGHYNQLAPAAFFGLGAGLELPNLHNPQYDFPDALLPYGLHMYWELIRSMPSTDQ